MPTAAEWRMAPENKKQGSGDAVYLYDAKGASLASGALLELVDKSLQAYEKALALGICPEQARLFLPAYGLYVRFIWTASLQGVAHFLAQRLKEDAQVEIQKYADAVYKLAATNFSVSLEELLEWLKR
jgi:thymidylate synthase (FAD)